MMLHEGRASGMIPCQALVVRSPTREYWNRTERLV